jgi:hypothetical protein
MDAPTYYEKILQPKCLFDVGKFVTRKAKEALAGKVAVDEAKVVSEFGDMFRLIVRNTFAFNNVGSVQCNNIDKVSLLFERLLFEWILAPGNERPIEECDDELCVHPCKADYPGPDGPDIQKLICERCEGHFNMGLLQPKVHTVPPGFWFCPHCCEKRCWFNTDPRLRQIVDKDLGDGEMTKAKIISCDVMDGQLRYTIKYVRERAKRAERERAECKGTKRAERERANRARASVPSASERNQKRCCCYPHWPLLLQSRSRREASSPPAIARAERAQRRCCCCAPASVRPSTCATSPAAGGVLGVSPRQPEICPLLLRLRTSSVAPPP